MNAKVGEALSETEDSLAMGDLVVEELCNIFLSSVDIVYAAGFENGREKDARRR